MASTLGLAGSTTVHSQRMSALADRPLDMEKVELAREELLKDGGENLMVEACSIVGAFALMTSVVDATGRRPFAGMAEQFAKKFGYAQ